MQSEAPKVQSEAPKVQSEAPKVQSEAPKVQSEAPKVQSEAPEVQSEAPKVQREAPKVLDFIIFYHYHYYYYYYYCHYYHSYHCYHCYHHQGDGHRRGRDPRWQDGAFSAGNCQNLPRLSKYCFRCFCSNKQTKLSDLPRLKPIRPHGRLPIPPATADRSEG